MAEHRVPLSRSTWSQFRRAVGDFANCEVGWRARGLFALLIALLLAFNGLNVLNSYVGRDFMTAIANRDSARFTREAIAYLDDRAYYRLSVAGVLTSPDERIAEDVRAFTATLLSFVLLVSNAVVTVMA